MAARKYPFYGHNQSVVFEKIIKGKYEPLPNYLSHKFH